MGKNKKVAIKHIKNKKGILLTQNFETLEKRRKHFKKLLAEVASNKIVEKTRKRVTIYSR